MQVAQLEQSLKEAKAAGEAAEETMRRWQQDAIKSEEREANLQKQLTAQQIRFDELIECERAKRVELQQQLATSKPQLSALTKSNTQLKNENNAYEFSLNELRITYDQLTAQHSPCLCSPQCQPAYSDTAHGSHAFNCEVTYSKFDRNITITLKHKVCLRPLSMLESEELSSEVSIT
jgi:hypothetical protein